MLDLIEFGAMIRAARERRGWRPIDLALAMGWSGTAPVYRMEQPGSEHRRPTPDTVNLLAQVLELHHADRLVLLGFAGHLMDTEPLTELEQAQTVARARPGLVAESEPVKLFDYRGRILDSNPAFDRALGIDRSSPDVWRRRNSTRFDLIWDPSLGIRQRVENAEAAAERQMLSFKLENRPRRHEAWYRRFAENRDHLPGFAELWRRTEGIVGDAVDEEEIERRLRTPVVFRPASGERWRFEIMERGLHGAYGLAGVSTWLPLDEATRRGVRFPVEDRAGVGACVVE